MSSKQKVCTCGGYVGRLVWRAQDKSRVALETVERPPGAEGFAVTRRRWVLERTFAWIMTCRRPVRDYERIAAVAETRISIAAIAILVRRAA
jgi:transposase